MNDRQSADDRLIRYLLGDDLTDGEQAAIEERYFSDDVYFDHVLAVEDDLIDSHVRGRLGGDAGSRFEKHFLASKRRREKWEAQRAIASFFRSRSEPVGFISACARFLRSLSPGARMWAGVSTALIATGVVFLSLSYLDLRRHTTDLESRAAELRQNLAQLPAMATFVLRPQTLRSGAGERLQIPAETKWVVFKAEIPPFASGYSIFTGALSTPEGRQIWSQTGLSRTESSIEIDLPGSVLKPGDYVLVLNAADGARQIPLPAYEFRVDR